MSHMFALRRRSLPYLVTHGSRLKVEPSWKGWRILDRTSILLNRDFVHQKTNNVVQAILHVSDLVDIKITISRPFPAGVETVYHDCDT
jgi:hypothetical protein